MSKYINPDQSTFIQGAKYRKGGGKGGGGSSGGVDKNVLEMAKKGNFKPYTLTTSAGQSYGDGKGKFGASASDPYQQISAESLRGVNQLLPQVADHFGREADQFNFSGGNVDETRNQIFQEQMSLLQPQFQDQNNAMANTMFGGGRMGLQIGGSNPDAFGLAKAQNQVGAQVAFDARGQALQHQQQQYGIESGAFGINNAMQQQRGDNLLRGAGSLYGYGTSVAEQELALLKAGSNAEALRGQSFTGGATALAGSVQPAKEGGGKGLIGSAMSAGATAYASDERLKDNVTKVGELPNGLNLYTWRWNHIAKDLGLDFMPEVGVMAQEVLEVQPKSVVTGSDGYLRVKYSEVLNG